MLAYLVIREGSKWTDVFRLVPGQAVTIGRAPTNQIVIKDERCSRCHAEIFFSEDQWMLRDLDSRNGTVVAQQSRPRRLRAASRATSFASASRNCAFVHDLSKAFSESSVDAAATSWTTGDVRRGRCTSATDDSSVLSMHEPATITHRRGQTQVSRAARSRGQRPAEDRPGRGQALPAGLRAGPGARRDRRWPTWRWPGCFEATQVDAGALFVLPRALRRRAARRATWKWSRPAPIRRCRTTASRAFLAATVLREGEAVLARNVMGDSTLGSRDSKGVIDATSVICAPIRRGKRVLGLMHLYSTDRRSRARSRRPGIHAGRGRHRGRGAGQPQPPRGAGREPEPDSRREPAAARAAGRAKRNRRPQHRRWPRWPRRSPAPRPAAPPC